MIKEATKTRENKSREVVNIKHKDVNENDSKL